VTYLPLSPVRASVISTLRRGVICILRLQTLDTARRRIFKLRLWSRCSRQRTSSDGFRVVDQGLLGAMSGNSFSPDGPVLDRKAVVRRLSVVSEEIPLHRRPGPCAGRPRSRTTRENQHGTCEEDTRRMLRRVRGARSRSKRVRKKNRDDRRPSRPRTRMLVGPDRIETDVNSKRCMDTRTRAAVPTHSCVLRASINGRMAPISSLYWNAYALNTTA